MLALCARHPGGRGTGGAAIRRQEGLRGGGAGSRVMLVAWHRRYILGSALGHMRTTGVCDEPGTVWRTLRLA